MKCSFCQSRELEDQYHCLNCSALYYAAGPYIGWWKTFSINSTDYEVRHYNDTTSIINLNENLIKSGNSALVFDGLLDLSKCKKIVSNLRAFI